MKELLKLTSGKLKEFFTRMHCELQNKPIPRMQSYPAVRENRLYKAINRMPPETFVSLLFTALGIILFLTIRLTV